MQGSCHLEVVVGIPIFIIIKIK